MEDNESRLCVRMTKKRSDFSFVRQNLSVLDAREICHRIALFIRNHQSGVLQSNQLIDSWEVWDLDDGDGWGKVCIVWNPATKQIRFSINNLDLWDAAIACDHAAAYFSAMLINPVEIQEREFANARTDNS